MLAAARSYQLQMGFNVGLSVKELVHAVALLDPSNADAVQRGSLRRSTAAQLTFDHGPLSLVWIWNCLEIEIPVFALFASLANMESRTMSELIAKKNCLRSVHTRAGQVARNRNE